MKMKPECRFAARGRAAAGKQTWPHVLTAWLCATALLWSTMPSPAGAPGVGGKRSVRVMTVNLYIGAGTERILAVDPADPDYLNKLVAAVTGVYYGVLASQPELRVPRVADEIASRLPDLVAVEEGTLIRLQSPGDLAFGGRSPATNVVFDYVQILVNALEERGVHYVVASASEEWDVELPMLNLQTGTIDDVRQTDREVILVRTDLPRGQLRVSHPRNGHFNNLVQYPAVNLSVTRGWCSVDVFARGEVFRYVCAHLEEETAPQIQVLQAQELLGGPVKTALPVIVAGDFNADPLHRDGSIAYDTLTAGGLLDARTLLNPADPAGGLTWGHDEFLADPDHAFDRRIDLILFRGGKLVPADLDVIDLTLGRTDAPLWASDHAAVAAEFCVKGSQVRDFKPMK